MWADLETFFAHHEHTVAALEAFSTFAVVVVSVTLAFLSQRANRTRIRALANRSVISHSTLEGQPLPRYITVNITNIGVMPVSIGMSFFFWRLPLARQGMWIIPWDHKQHDEWVPQKKYPVEIRPRASESFFLHDLTTFGEAMAEALHGSNWLQRLRGRFLQAYVMTDDGRRFRVKFGKGLSLELKAQRQQNVAAAPTGA